MVFKYADRVQETTGTTGTGDITLGGTATGFRTFSSALSTNDWTYYCIVHRTADEWETGIGILSGASTLVRVAMLSSSTGALVNFSSGVKDIFISIPSAMAGLDEAAIFGDGSDGDLTISSGVTNLAGNMNYMSVTISGTASIQTNGYELKVAGKLDLTNAPANAITASAGLTHLGRVASGQLTYGRNTSIYGLYLPMGYDGSAGAAINGMSANVPTDAEQTYSVNYFGMIGGQGSVGGTSNFGGSGGSVLINAENKPFFHWHSPFPARCVAGGGGSGGGGAYAGTSGVGGAGGAGGNCVRVCARVLVRTSACAAKAISADGGNGANGAVGSLGYRGGGGGGAGGGGVAVVIVGAVIGASTTANLISASGGTGGTGGNGSLQEGGNGANGGYGGRIFFRRLGGPGGSLTYVIDDTGQAGDNATAPAYQVGGAGGAGRQTLWTV